MEQSLLVEHILKLEKRLMNYDYKVLDELLADDFLEYGSSGNSFDKKAQLDAVKGSKT
ncbi:nuclear transport factor 2 family protein [Bacillus shivajii]|uniref:nuclear transport factor 2 family protein n=1 Tax=Bacillus shivajii TaxID=1983719 RepID=UPI001CFAE5F4|nr:nuclear transport factor 2 family protein [Bacillus shivajii]UCZ54915.1 nuclear transport factor 2 family protein [Bacillus shivajii]